MDIAIPLFDDITALDAIGPYEVLQRLPGARVRFVGHRRGTVRTANGSLGLVVDEPFDAVPAPDVIVVPGGSGVAPMLEDPTLLDWVRRAHETSTWTTSVCTGSLILAAAGLLDGLEATTHWSARDQLAELGAVPVARRVVEQGKIVTAAGVSAGIDMALTLAARIAGDEIAQSIQLVMEYDPQPPFDTGSLERASPAVVALANA